MSWVLIRKTIRDYSVIWAGILILLAGFVVLFMVATDAIPTEKMDIARIPFIRRLMTVMIGSDPLEDFNPTTITAFVFTHPMVWVLLVTFAITTASGVLAGEMDRGTMDLLVVLPISRAAIYNSLAIVLLILGLPLSWAVWVFTWLGREMVHNPAIRMDLMVRVTWNFYLVYVLIASFSLAISAASARRGPAVGAAFFVVFYAFVLNLLRAMWPALDVIDWSDFLSYYQPLMIIKHESYRVGDLIVLATTSVVFWFVGLVVWVRRDIPAR
jgi:ABC-type transport system involved in multi-copper enzyme maturation permease subunit